MAQLSRRAVLGATAGAAAVTAITPVSLATMSSHPDAELLARGEEYVRIGWLLNDYSITLPSPEVERLSDEHDDLRAKIVNATAHTPAGIAVKLRAAWMMLADTPEEILHGPDDHTDLPRRIIWQTMLNAQQMAAA